MSVCSKGGRYHSGKSKPTQKANKMWKNSSALVSVGQTFQLRPCWLWGLHFKTGIAQFETLQSRGNHQREAQEASCAGKARQEGSSACSGIRRMKPAALAWAPVRQWRDRGSSVMQENLFFCKKALEESPTEGWTQLLLSKGTENLKHLELWSKVLFSLLVSYSLPILVFPISTTKMKVNSSSTRWSSFIFPQMLLFKSISHCLEEGFIS